jgi:hypothetical protein
VNDEVAIPRFFFTSPWDPLSTRRGDALGLRAFADVLADSVAPDLSNRVQDGRWVTILSWCLVRSQSAYHAAGGSPVLSRAQQRQRYAWLRPLELMWIARTIRILSANDGWRSRTLPGQRRVGPWVIDDRMRPDSFGMSPDQFGAYRQTGPYGGYRVAFRRWPGMTSAEDGWTPGPAARELAKWLDSRLGGARPAWPLQAADGDGPSTRSAKLGLGSEEGWWIRQWSQFGQAGRGSDVYTLPRPRREYTALPEKALLEPLIFGSGAAGERRRTVALEIQAAKPGSHLAACEALAKRFLTDPEIQCLPLFSRLADAGIDAMQLISDRIREQGPVDVNDVASSPAAKDVCSELLSSARAWLEKAPGGVRHIDGAHRFAETVAGATTRDCLQKLVQYHEMFGGGQQWFVERDGQIQPRVPPRGQASRYRFRLWSLCRLGAQCGVLRTLPKGLREEQAIVDEMESGDE